MPHQLQHLDGAGHRPPSTTAPWMAQTFSAICVADRQHRVQAGHRLLEDHRDALPRIARISAIESVSRSAPSKRIAAPTMPGRLGRDQPQDRHAR
jgi:hypothetical protein